MNARDLVQRETGLDLPAAAVERAVAARVAALGLRDEQAYLRALSPAEFQALVELVVVPESWMFRDADAFAALARAVCERLAHAPGRPVRILSIPCAGGEEPYSIAMALQDARVPRGAVAIEAVDLSEVALDRARRGRYTRNAFRGASLGFRDRYFTAVGNEYQIQDELREQVRFSQGNLLALDVQSAVGWYDIIFCRNLLIYFDDAATATAVAKLRLLLADDGMLFAGYAEVPAFCRNDFAPLRVPGAFALQKERRAAPRAEAAHQPAVRPRARAPEQAPPPARARPAVRAPAAPAASAQAQLELAGRLADQGDYAGAAAACHALLRGHPESAGAYYLLGMVSECQDKPGAADDYWRRCVYLQPDHYEALCHLALLAEQNGNPAEARAFKQRAARVFGRRDGHKARNQA